MTDSNLNQDNELRALFASSELDEIELLETASFMVATQSSLAREMRFKSLLIEAAQYFALSIGLGLLLMLLSGAISLSLPDLHQFLVFIPKFDTRIALLVLILASGIAAYNFANQE